MKTPTEQIEERIEELEALISEEMDMDYYRIIQGEIKGLTFALNAIKNYKQVNLKTHVKHPIELYNESRGEVILFTANEWGEGLKINGKWKITKDESLQLETSEITHFMFFKTQTP